MVRVMCEEWITVKVRVMLFRSGLGSRLGSCVRCRVIVMVSITETVRYRPCPLTRAEGIFLSGGPSRHFSRDEYGFVSGVPCRRA